MRRPRTDGSRLALLAAAAFAVLLLSDTAAMIGGRWEYPPIARSEGGLLEAAGRAGARNRTLNVYVGLAVREVAGGPPRRVVVPRDLGSLTSRTPDEFEGIPQDVLAPHLLAPLLAGAEDVRDYDPRLPDRAMEQLLHSGWQVRELPEGVRALVPPEGDAGSGVVRDEVALFCDAEGETIVAVPLALSPLEELR